MLDYIRKGAVTNPYIERGGISLGLQGGAIALILGRTILKRSLGFFGYDLGKRG